MKKLKEFYLDPLATLLKNSVQLLKPEAFDFTKKHSDPGAAPGIEYRKDIKESPNPGEIGVSCIDYSESEFTEKTYDHIDDFLTSKTSNPTGYQWININGVNPYVINRLKEHYNLHTLAAEDALNIPQRPKVENYEGQVFIIIRMLMLENNQMTNEQISFFFLGNTLITVQENPGDTWGKIRKRIKKPGSRFRKLGNAYLLYALIDAIIDHIFPLLEKYGDILDELELQVLQNPKPAVQQHIHKIRSELSTYRRIVVPTREMLYKIHQDKEEAFDNSVTHFFGDVHDHAQQLLDTIESYREMSNGLNELYHTIATEKLNETMKLLTLMASFFIPLTFFAGIYGMNFKHMPELDWLYAYPTFWAICLTISGSMFWYFRRKGWIGNR